MLSIFDTLITTSSITDMSVGTFLTCISMSLLFGIILALSYNYKNEVTKSFSVTLALLPPTVALVIMMVNGSIGTGIAVAGSFSLIRFRSQPGTGREIVGIFLGMAAGITAGMGYIAFGLIFTVFAILSLLILENVIFKEKLVRNKTLRITIPEDLEYETVFTDLLEKYCTKYNLRKVKTVNLGSLIKLTYDLELKNEVKEKSLIDEIRTRNGNLEISCAMQQTTQNSL